MDELQLKLCDIQGTLFELSAVKKIAKCSIHQGVYDLRNSKSA